MGLTLHVYRWGVGDCSNGGISGRCDEVTAVNVEGPFEPSEDRPAVMVVPGAYPGIVRVVPAEKVRRCIECGTISDDSAEPICNTGGFTGGHAFGDEWIEMRHDVGPMMGGAYVATPDSRWSVIWSDIWIDLCEDNLEEMATLRRKFGRRCDWHGCWSREILLHERRRTAAAPWR